MIGEDLLGQRLIAGKRQPARVAAGVGLLAQLEIAHDMLVEMADAVELLDEVEGDVRLVRIDGAADGREVVRNADGNDLVPELLDRIAHVELGLA